MQQSFGSAEFSVRVVPRSIPRFLNKILALRHWIWLGLVADFPLVENPRGDKTSISYVLLKLLRKDRPAAEAHSSSDNTNMPARCCQQ